MPHGIGAAFALAVSEAWRFAGQTAPNPPVGCVLLDAEGAVLVIAAHHRAGEWHAERLAVEQARALGVVERIHTAVVTLEPCNHTGRTPPCTEALLSTPVKTVWIGCADPNAHVQGGGGARLQAARCDVRWLAHSANGEHAHAQCRALIAPFASKVARGRPWITVKQALDSTGSMIPPAGRTTFTTPASLRFAHALRRVSDGVITATGTVRADRPGLGVRHVEDHTDRRRLLVICGQEANTPQDWLAGVVQRFDVRFCPDISDLEPLLARTDALWLLVEAGPTLLAALHARNLWDDWLTIRQDPDGQDHLSVRTRHDITPLSLFAEWAHCTQEQVCFPVS
ncbi:bifunctional diaminohydroxyphosphoribosylaminopyrimidine deaminase/5-amino-6-(5-phosphoribosylamino)uracil reductase RibD [Acetobacter sp. TBRC 12305]|uniref:Riboflavin biosynthesis protein RibD n=1 Tax=Acetobacter garciniae TaxID=2817435 RepID=A0A939KP59_9PROT|nr:bifunctional diaminohydroxyphosphoribosylaminopyrimidine deaminase/5-amino-6-(5-phosphoribosylamino)uracil reductase RibD [Acetobacter garciniae]MBO1326455.1 bifunctional diaminohydroxyphosphoribosylaminopyrimidine deaminase/5-amino-6-(5-phosphoribosylamino)uracil reductase RibD [Acetobacter garciniae]MBX0346090.1 bifunctional diaminohydroxyphosphoribosylaminopyrimidine deaminase/5-amino-6-(5-phosphoribosylamino)uracil reductase RibD [Acetobacter garciniae]